MSALKLPMTTKQDTQSVPEIDALIGSGLTKSILDSSPDCIKLLGLDGALLYMNQNGLCAMEIDNFSACHNEAWPSLWPADSQGLLQAAIEDASLGEATSFDAYCPTARGVPRWWHVNVSPVRGEDGKVIYILATSRDITASITSEQNLRERDIQLQAYAENLASELEEKEILIERQRLLGQEIDHRVKNSFTLIGSILRMKMRLMEEGDAREALADTANRIATLARVHEQLHIDAESRHVGLAPYLKKLTKDLGETLADDSRVVLAKATDLTVSSEDAVAIGLVTSELVSNALKHADTGKPITVIITLTEDKKDDTMLLRVEDTGSGLPKDFDIDDCDGLGMQICKTYSRTLNGILSAENTITGGAAFMMRFPRALPSGGA